MAESPLTINPLFRMQVLLENEPGKPTKEFKAGDLSEPSFNALAAARMFQMALPNEDPDQYNSTFKYRLEERHESHWVNFENTEGLGFAIQSNEVKGYIFISASFVQKGAPVLAVCPGIVSSSPQVKTKHKVAKKKAKMTKHKATTRDLTMSVEQKILLAMKELLELGVTSPPRKQIALCSGYTNVKSKAFKDARCFY